MVSELLRIKVNRIRRIIKLLGFRKGSCLDNFEVMSKINEIERKSKGELWVLGWSEHSFSDGVVIFIRLVDGDGDQFLVRLIFNVSSFSFEIPMDNADMFEEVRGITFMRVGDHVQITGKVMCITDVGVRRLKW